MNSIVYKTGLFCLIAVTALVLSGCEESLTSSNTDDIPSLSGDSTDVAFVSIVSGSQSDPVVGTAERIPLGLFGGGATDMVTVEVEPNFAVQEDIEVGYDLAGTASTGEDYSIPNSNPDIIEFNATNTSIDRIDLQVVGGATQEVPLTTEFRTVEISLTSASTTSGGREVLVGRGGSDIGTTRIVRIAPSITLLSSGFAPIEGVATGEAAVGDTSDTNVIFLNSSNANFDVTDVSISGENASEFEVNSLISNPVEPGQTPAPSEGEFSPIIGMSFIPDSEGDKSATLSIDVSNSFNSTTVEYPVTGTAVSE
jgi:hypothetical protein